MTDIPGDALCDGFGIELDEQVLDSPGALTAALDRSHVVRIRGVEWDERRQLEVTASLGTVVGRRTNDARGATPNIRLEQGADRFADRWHADLSWSTTDAVSVLVCLAADERPDPTAFLDTSVGLRFLDDGLVARCVDRTVTHDLVESRRRRPPGSQRHPLLGRATGAFVGRVQHRWRRGRLWPGARAAPPEWIAGDLSIPAQHDRLGSHRLLLDRCVSTDTPFLRLGDHAWHVSGLDDEASDALLAQLHAEVDRPESTWQQVWRIGDVVIYDNRMVLHRRVGTVGAPAGRELRRTLADRSGVSSGDLSRRRTE